MPNNYRFILSYDGTRYFGWEHQPNTPLTIQGKLEDVLTRMCGSPVEVIGAGRTDAGVHARAMTANAFLETGLSEQEILAYMNRYLPEDICVQEVKQVSERFHSRYKATGKTYRYTCYYGDRKPVFNRKYVTVLDAPVNLSLMEEAARHLVGTHDFFSFCSNPHMKKSTVRTVDSLVIKENDGYYSFIIHGDGFLQNMVRIIVGTLIEAGKGKLKPEALPAILEARDRTKAGPTMPPQGLTLIQVDYS